MCTSVHNTLHIDLLVCTTYKYVPRSAMYYVRGTMYSCYVPMYMYILHSTTSYVLCISYIVHVYISTCTVLVPGRSMLVPMYLCTRYIVHSTMYVQVLCLGVHVLHYLWSKHYLVPRTSYVVQGVTTDFVHSSE